MAFRCPPGVFGLVLLGSACAGDISGMEMGPAPPGGSTNPARPPVATNGPGGEQPGGMPGAMLPPGTGGPGTPGTGGNPGVTPGSPGSAGPAPISPVASGRLWRLSHDQWENAARDLLRLPSTANLSAAFTGDPVQGRFDNSGSVLQVTSGLRRDYQQAAESLAEKVTADPAALARLLPAGLPTDPTARAKAFIEGFGKRAYRRPLTAAEVTRYTNLFSKGATLIGGKDPFVDGVRLSIETFLQSTHFLYRTEFGSTVAAGRVTLSPWELASKLSFALATTMPDDELMAAAQSGMINNRDTLKLHATRLLAQPRAADLIEDFHAQLLRMGPYDQIDKDKKLFPAFTTGLGADLRAETLAFVREVAVERKGGLQELLLTPVSFVNKRTAPFYGLPGTFGDTLTKVDLDKTQRAGILTQLGFLMANARRDEVDSIHRGVSIHGSILCTNLPPPAEGASLSGAKGRTNREKVTSVTGDGTCGAGCHSAVINPVGFAFEAYDAVGKFRAQDNGVAVDSTGSYTFGGEKRSWNTGLEFVKHVAASPEAHECYARGWLEYLYGRAPEEGDKPLLGFVGGRSRSESLPVKDLLLALVMNDSFLTRSTLSE